MQRCRARGRLRRIDLNPSQFNERSVTGLRTKWLGIIDYCRNLGRPICTLSFQTSPIVWQKVADMKTSNISEMENNNNTGLR